MFEHLMNELLLDLLEVGPSADTQGMIIRWAHACKKDNVLGGMTLEDEAFFRDKVPLPQSGGVRRKRNRTIGEPGKLNVTYDGSDRQLIVDLEPSVMNMDIDEDDNASEFPELVQLLSLLLHFPSRSGLR